MKRKTIIAGVVAAGCMIAVLGVLFFGGGAAKVDKATVVREHVTDFYTEEGVLSSGKQYEIIAEVSGAVQEIAVEENAHVKKGDVLLQIDSADYEHEKYMVDRTILGYEAQLDESRISRVMMSTPKEYLDEIKQALSVSEAQYQAAKTVYEGSQVLYEAGSISKVDMEQKVAEYQSAKLALEQAKSRYEESSRLFAELEEEGIDKSQVNARFYESEEKQHTAQIEVQKRQSEQLAEKIEKCTITAPEDGVVTELPVKNQSVIQMGQTAVSITGAGQMTAEADVLTNIAPYLKAGDPAEIVLKLRGKDVTYTGTIREVYDFAKKGVSSLGLDEYRVYVIVDLDAEQNAELSGVDGYGVNVKLCLFDQDDCLTVPSAAVYQVDGKSYVYRIEGGQAMKQEVDVTYQSGTMAVIEGGLNEGDMIVAQVDSEGIYDGAKVK